VVVVLAAGATTAVLLEVLRYALAGLRDAVLVAETLRVVAVLAGTALVSVVVVISVVVVLGARCTVSRTTTGTSTVLCTVSRTTTTEGTGAGGVTTGAGFACDSLLVALPAGAFIAVGVPFPVILTLVTVVPSAFSLTFFLTSTLFFVVSNVCASAVWTIQTKLAVSKIKLSFFMVFVMFLLYVTNKLPQMLIPLI
jgi:hypothetical protein